MFDIKNIKEYIFEFLESYKKFIFAILILIFFIIGVPSSINLLWNYSSSGIQKATIQQEIGLLNKYNGFIDQYGYETKLSSQGEKELNILQGYADNIPSTSVGEIVNSIKNYNNLNQEQIFGLQSQISTATANLENKQMDITSGNVISVVGIVIAVVGLMTTLYLALKFSVI